MSIQQLLSNRYCWLVTGVAGFIGSHILELLLKNKQKVRGMDDFSTGHKANLDHVRANVGEKLWTNFEFKEASIEDFNLCKKLSIGVDFILHQAALGSVPRSIESPIRTHQVNVSGFLNILEASRINCVKRLIYASSSSVYGDSVKLPKTEDLIGKPLSPYALSKQLNEQYAELWYRLYGTTSVGLRYFNVFGPRQNPNGEYAAVIPRWILALKQGKACEIYGDGLQSRDFCYVDNVVQANIKAALVPNIRERVFNIACSEQLSLLELHEILAKPISKHFGRVDPKPEMLEARKGDVKHSLADISKARLVLGYDQYITAKDGLRITVAAALES